MSTSNVPWLDFRYRDANKSAENDTYSTTYKSDWGFNAQINGVTVVSGSSHSKRWYPSSDVNTVDTE